MGVGIGVAKSCWFKVAKQDSTQVEYQSLLDFATSNGITLPSSEQQTKDNLKVKYFKDEGVWDEIDVMYIFNSTYTSTGFSDNFYALNWKNPNTFRLTADSGKEPSFVSGSGFKTVGGSGDFLKTGFVPTDDAVNFEKLDGGLIFKCFDVDTTFSSSTYFLGGRNVSTNQILIGNNSNNNMALRINGNDNPLVITQANVNQHYHTATVSSDSNRYVNGVFQLTQPHETNGTVAEKEQYLLAYNNNDVAVTPSNDAGLSYVLFGSNLASKQLEIYQILNETY